MESLKKIITWNALIYYSLEYLWNWYLNIINDSENYQKNESWFIWYFLNSEMGT